jgi:hypothetical protein
MHVRCLLEPRQWHPSVRPHRLLIGHLSPVIGFRGGRLVKAGMPPAGRPAIRPTLSDDERGEVPPSGSSRPKTKGDRQWMATSGSPTS